MKRLAVEHVIRQSLARPTVKRPKPRGKRLKSDGLLTHHRHGKPHQ